MLVSGQVLQIELRVEKEAFVAQQLGNIRGRTVIAGDGQAIGEVEDLVVDTASWRVESLQLKVSKDMADQLGIRRGIFRGGRFHLPVEFIQSIGDSIILKVPSQELRKSLVGASDAAGR